MASSSKNATTSILKTCPSGVEESLGKEPLSEFSLPNPSSTSTRKEVRFGHAAQVKEFETGSSCSSSDNSCTPSSSSSPRVIHETLEDMNVSLLEESCDEYGPPSSIDNSSMDEAITPPSPPNEERPMALQRSCVPLDYSLMCSPVSALSLQIRDMSLGTTQVPSHSRQRQVHAAGVINESKDAYIGVSEQNLSSQQPSDKKSALSELPLEPITEETSPQSIQSLNETMASGKMLMQDSDSESVATFNEDDDVQVIPESPEFLSKNNSDSDATQSCATPESSTNTTSNAERLSNLIQNFIDTHTDEDPLEHYFFMKDIETELAKLSEEDWNNILSSYAEFFGDGYIRSILIHRDMYEGAVSCRIRRMLYGARYGLSTNRSEAH